MKEYGYRQGELLIVGDVEASCAVRWLVTDQIGTPRMLADTTGSLAGISRHDYLPYGEELTAGYGSRTNAQGYTGDCVRDKFAGYERDAETGLDYAEARYYGSAYGRFTSVDPAMGSARKSMPQSWNRYSYVLNRPLSLIDPTGEFWIHKANEELKFIRKGAPTAREKKKYEAEGYEIIEDNTPVTFYGGGTPDFAFLRGKRAILRDNGEFDVIHPADKLAPVILGIYWGGPLIGLALTPVATEIGTATTAARLMQILGTPQGLAAIGLIGGLGGATLGDVLTDAAPDDNDEQDVFVVRGGIATPEQLQNGVAEHIAVPGLTGFSVQSEPGKTIEELAAAGQFRNAQISVTTVRELENAGVKLEPTPGRGYHKTAMTPMPLPPDQAAKISAVFKPVPNPARLR